MTEKKEQETVAKEGASEEQGQFSIEGADALFEEALAAVDKKPKGGAAKKPAPVAAKKPATAEPPADEGEEEIIWEEPEVREDEGGSASSEEQNALLQKVEELEKKLEEETAERKKTYEQLLRMTAEFDNYRKRTTREKDDLRKFGHRDVMSDMLEVADNFERALTTITEADESLREGIGMVHRQFVDIMNRHGVKKFESAKQPFDYTLHQAISTFETDEVPPQTVYEAFKEGYKFHDQLLRPAMVVVSKALPKPAEEAPIESEQPPAEAEEAAASESADGQEASS